MASTEINNSVKNIILRLMSVYGLRKPKEAADKLGVSSQVLNNWISRNSPAAAEKIREVIGGDIAEAIVSGMVSKEGGSEDPLLRMILDEVRAAFQETKNKSERAELFSNITRVLEETESGRVGKKDGE